MIIAVLAAGVAYRVAAGVITGNINVDPFFGGSCFFRFSCKSRHKYLFWSQKLTMRTKIAFYYRNGLDLTQEELAMIVGVAR